MPYTTEDEVRLRFQLEASEAPAELVAACIAEAHEHILRFLDPQFDTPDPPGALALGETYLAGAFVLRALASRRALDPRGVAVGGQRIDDGDRFKTLTNAVATAAGQAWTHLEPYLLERPASVPAGATETTPILGEG